MRVDDRAAALAHLLELAGHDTTGIVLARPTSATLPAALGKEVAAVYRALGGVQAEPALRPGAWDLGCDGYVVELDEALHFNRYRQVTLARGIYRSLPAFPRARYRFYCDEYERHCLSKGRGQARWTSPASEEQFGRSGPRGFLDGPGAARWKQRALYDFMKDLSLLAGGPAVARVAVWDTVPLHGREVAIDTILRAEPDLDSARAVSRLVATRRGAASRRTTRS